MAGACNTASCNALNQTVSISGSAVLLIIWPDEEKALFFASDSLMILDDGEMLR